MPPITEQIYSTKQFGCIHPQTRTARRYTKNRTQLQAIGGEDGRYNQPKSEARIQMEWWLVFVYVESPREARISPNILKPHTHGERCRLHYGCLFMFSSYTVVHRQRVYLYMFYEGFSGVVIPFRDYNIYSPLENTFRSLSLYVL